MHDIADYPTARQVPGLVVYRYDSPLFFANSDDFLSRAEAAAFDPADHGDTVEEASGAEAAAMENETASQEGEPEGQEAEPSGTR